ncbi:hypothetical protein KGQ31_00170 [Patescibacteria group bacterium]|nr:hypothetical protein [Patescibacteria group bacterium]
MKNLKKSLQVVSLLAVVAAALISAAPKSSFAYIDATKYVPLAPIEGTCSGAGGTCAGNAPTNLSSYLTGMFRVGVVAAGILAFLVIVWGGFTYLSTDAITGKEEGRAYISRAVGGLLLALASYVILYTINPSLVNLDLYFGSQANPDQPITAASSPTKQLDDLVASMNQNVNATVDQVRGDQIQANALQQNLETAHANYAVQQEALRSGDITRDQFNAELADGTIIDDATYAAGMAQVAAIQTGADAVGHHQTALETIANLRASGIGAVNSRDNAAEQQTAAHIFSQANIDIAGLQADGQKDPTNKTKYDGWIADIRQANDAATLSLGSLSAASDGHMAKYIMDQVYQQNQLDIKNAGSDQAQISAANTRYNLIISTLQLLCANNSACKNYDPAHP